MDSHKSTEYRKVPEDALAAADADDHVALKKNLNVVRTMSYVVGTVIGSGIFISPKGILQNVDLSVGVSLIVWLACGLVAMTASLMYCEFCTRYPRTGGYFIYLKETWGDMVAFVFLWSNVIITGPSSVATKILTLSVYIIQPIRGFGCPIPAFSMPLLGTAVILLLAYINYSHSSWGANFQVMTTVGKVLGLIIITITGFVYLARGSTSQFTRDSLSSYQLDVGALVFAFYSGMWAYAGWDTPTHVAGEVKSIKRTLPVSILGGMTIVTIIYMLTNVAYFSVLSPEQIVSSAAVAYTFADVTLGIMSWLIPLSVCISLVGSLNSSVFVTSRNFFAASEEGHFPALFSLLNVDHKTPIISIAIFTALSVIMIWVLEIYELINYLSFALWLEEFFISTGLIYLRVRDWKRNQGSSNIAATDTSAAPEEERVKFPIAIYFVYTLFALALTTLSFIKRPTNSIIGLGILAIAIPIYFLFIKFDTLSKRLKPYSDRLTAYCQMATNSVLPKRD